MLDFLNSDLQLQKLHVSMAHFWEDFIGSKGENELTYILPIISQVLNIF